MLWGRDSSVGIATRLRAEWSGDRIPVGARFSALVQTGPGAHPASYTMGTASFPEVKRPGRGVDHPPPSSSEVEGRVELYFYSPSRYSWPVLGRTLPLPFIRCYEFWFEKPQIGASGRIRAIPPYTIFIPLGVATTLDCSSVLSTKFFACVCYW